MFLANQRLAWGNVKLTDQKEPNIMDVWRPRMVRNSVALLRYPEDSATAKTQPIHLSFTKGIPCLDLCGKKVPQNSRDEHHLSSTMEIYYNTATYLGLIPRLVKPTHIIYCWMVPIISNSFPLYVSIRLHPMICHDIPINFGWFTQPTAGTCLWLRR